MRNDHRLVKESQVPQVMVTHRLQSQGIDHMRIEDYYRVLRYIFITDGVEYLATKANSCWLVTAIYSHLVTKPIHSEFIVARLVVSGKTANLVLDDGNDQVICEQYIEYTDFPLDALTIYCSYQERLWVLLLASEY
jgi:hypothetical protein